MRKISPVSNEPKVLRCVKKCVVFSIELQNLCFSVFALNLYDLGQKSNRNGQPPVFSILFSFAQLLQGMTGVNPGVTSRKNKPTPMALFRWNRIAVRYIFLEYSAPPLQQSSNISYGQEVCFHWAVCDLRLNHQQLAS